MAIQNNIYLPDQIEFINGYQIYNQKERNGFIWFEALKIVQDNWGESKAMSDGVSRIIRGWNRFYAKYDTTNLISTIESNLAILATYRDRDISTYGNKDKSALLKLFNDFADALKRVSDKRKSPVSVAKALSLFAPSFLPIWDSNIAYAYGYLYVCGGDTYYIAFMDNMKQLADYVRTFVPSNDDRSLLKRIDEYNYSKYTMHWI